MASQQPTVAFFGATGGVTNAVIVNALRAGRNVVALARTPSKLTQQLQAQNISETLLASQLTIISGNAHNVADVKSVLTANQPNHLVSHIISGLGGNPKLQFAFNPLNAVTIDQPGICGNAAKTLLTALQEIYAEKPALAQHKPKLTFVSTTGISNGPEDVPFGLQTLYHQILAVPHLDKREMEAVFRDNMAGMDGKQPLFSGYIGVRPTLLTGGINADEGIGAEKLRVGTEVEPSTGWSVGRSDVGQWIWINAVSDEGRRQEWENKMVTLTK